MSDSDNKIIDIMAMKIETLTKKLDIINTAFESAIEDIFDECGCLSHGKKRVEKCKWDYLKCRKCVRDIYIIDAEIEYKEMIEEN